MPSPRRNDPCPCGSGRKFKLCCLPQPRLASGITPKDRSEALLALIRYSRRDEFASAVAEATCQWAAQDDGDVNAALQTIVEFQTSADAFCEWLSFDLRLDDGRTLSDWFMDSHGRTVSPRASDHIRLMRQTHLRPFEVRDVTVGAGLTLRDLWTKEEYFVTERKGSTQIVKWDILAARVNTLADGSREIEGTMMRLPPHAAKPLLKTLRAEYKAFAARHPTEPVAEFFKFAAPHFHDFWYEETAVRRPPRLTTVEGHEITVSELVFSVPKAGVALATLLRQPDFEPGEPGCAAWLEPGREPRRILGEVECGTGTLTVRTLSRERAERARARLVELLGPLTLRDEHHHRPDLDAPLQPEELAAPDDLVSIEDVPELAEWQAQKDREWLDLEIPALDAHTPREAARDARLRPRLRALLIDIENRQARMLGAQRDTDLSWMWKELGLRH